MRLEGAMAQPGDAYHDATGKSLDMIYALRTGFTLRGLETEAR